MEFEKVYTDFEKRYERKCGAAYFIGLPLVFLSSDDTVLGCAVSAGGYAAERDRDDERIMMQFSDNDRFLNCSIAEIKENKNIGGIFERAEKAGKRIRGADILMRYNTKLTDTQNQMLIRLLGKNTDIFEFIKCFDDYEKNFVCMFSRKNHAVCRNGQEISYLPFSDSEVKIVITDIGGRSDMVTKSSREATEKCIRALNDGDYEKFGKILSEQTAKCINGGALKNLFFTAERLGDACGNGICGGRLFSVVKNSAVDTYMNNLNREYGRYFGGNPDFYVMRSEDSGICNVPDESD